MRIFVAKYPIRIQVLVFLEPYFSCIKSSRNKKSDFILFHRGLLLFCCAAFALLRIEAVCIFRVLLLGLCFFIAARIFERISLLLSLSVWLMDLLVLLLLCVSSLGAAAAVTVYKQFFVDSSPRTRRSVPTAPENRHGMPALRALVSSDTDHATRRFGVTFPEFRQLCEFLGCRSAPQTAAPPEARLGIACFLFSSLLSLFYSLFSLPRCFFLMLALFFSCDVALASSRWDSR